MKPVTSISLGLENCVSINIMAKDVNRLIIRNIKEDIELTQPYDGTLYTANPKTCESLYLELKSSANRPFYEGDNLTSVFDRLTQYDDITDIALHHEDGDTTLILVPYDGDEINDCQSHERVRKGLNITINKNDNKKE